MLSNILYLGKIEYQGEVIEGEHEAILSEEVWRQVQDTLRRHRNDGGASVRNKHGALLKGLLYCAPCGTAMSHKWTAKKNHRRYHYYVCTTAEKQGWDSCPTKSLPAPAIERFVVERIRCIGEDPALVAATIHQAREQNKKRVQELEHERKLLEGELKQLDAQVRKLIGGLAPNSNGAPRTTAKLADLQDRIQANEQRATNIREELIAHSGELVDERDLASALSLFDPVWESLSSPEQTRVMRLLVERIAYDGNNETLAITFRPTGIKALAGEMNIQGGDKRK
jgi:site-specific DNA recombinase